MANIYKNTGFDLTTTDKTDVYTVPANRTAVVKTIQTTNSRKVVKVTDLLGRETKATNQLLFYIYNDGTVEKKVVIE